MEKGDRKRSREDRHDETSSPPSYGSQGYWEERYKRLQIHASKDGNENKGDEEPEAFHAWYFSYEELSPLILSLIVGDIPADDTVATIVEPQEKKIFLSKGKPLEDTKDTYAHSHAQKELEAVSESADENDSQVDVQEGDEEGSVVEDEEWSEDEGIILVEDEGDDDDDEGPPQRVGLAKDGPIDILEVGCGDVPLGQDIISSIRELYRSEKRKDAGKILKSVTCIDYSSTVIEAMKAKQTSQTSGEPLIPLEFTCADARKLPYQDERFHFVLEKGTMDAMLSDSDMGSDNCRSIVAEMARVVTVGGSIMIISHINAQTENGIDWLNNIVVPGLRNGAGLQKWSVEVHGGDIPESQEDDDEDKSIVLGPAVYIIHKEGIVKRDSMTDDTDPPTISLRFYSY